MKETVLFGGGCFWYVEPAFAALTGVTYAYPGYSGGLTHYPTHEQVAHQGTGHIEVVHVRYSPNKISFKTLLETFFFLHDPTSIDRQGVDVGSQYASAIFYTTPKQHQEAKVYIAALEKKLKKPVVTKLMPAIVFWPASSKHFNYYKHNSLEPYSFDVIRPILRSFSKAYSHLIKEGRPGR